MLFSEVPSQPNCCTASPLFENRVRAAVMSHDANDLPVMLGDRGGSWISNLSAVYASLLANRAKPPAMNMKSSLSSPLTQPISRCALIRRCFGYFSSLLNMPCAFSDISSSTAASLRSKPHVRSGSMRADLCRQFHSVFLFFRN